jgi:hypothetical protein
MKVTRITRTEFELEDGTIHPITPPLEEDMTPEEFQEHYDRASNFIASIQNPGGNNPNPKKLE